MKVHPSPINLFLSAKVLPFPLRKNVGRIPHALPIRVRAFSTANEPYLTCANQPEPIDRYHTGGFHPIHLGDSLHDKRYKILHKLGWGAYSTVWAARDQILQQNVSIKITTSSKSQKSNEVAILQHLAAKCASTPTKSLPPILQLLDTFQLHGPNGTHTCLVTELCGPTIPIALDRYKFIDDRLPASWTKSIAGQLLTGVEFLHQHGVGHGDIHIGNIALTTPQWTHLPEQTLLSLLGQPKLHHTPTSSTITSSSPPKYTVSPSTLPIPPLTTTTPEVRLIDFGASFTSTTKPTSLSTPLDSTAPELYFNDKWDQRVDLWSTGCTIFNMILGEPPFADTFTPEDVVISEMESELGPLPDRWSKQLDWYDENWGSSYNAQHGNDWLSSLYEDSCTAWGKEKGESGDVFTREELEVWEAAVRKLVVYEAVDRMGAGEVREWVGRWGGL